MDTANPQLEPRVVPSGTGPFVDLGDHRGHVKLSARDTGGAFCLFDFEVDPGGNVPPHIHRHEEETFYILHGRFAFGIGEQAIDAGPGDIVFAPGTWRTPGAASVPSRGGRWS